MTRSRKGSARRYAGEGNIRQRKDGRWAVSISHDGKRYYRYAHDKNEAKQVLKDLKKEIEQGIKPDAPKFTVTTYLEYWLTTHRSRIRETTYTTYQNSIKQLDLVLGSHKLSTLSGDQIQLAYMKMQKELHLSSGTIKLTHSILKTALDDAVSWHYIAANPAEHAGIPQGSHREKKFLSLGQAKLLLANTGGQMTCLLTLAVATGMRRGEILGLKWNDVDFNTKRLSINRTLSYLTIDGETKYIETPPKTDYGKRSIQLPDFVVTALHTHRATQLERQLKVGSAWEPHDLVFTNATGYYFNPRSVTRYFHSILERAGLEHMRFHDLRHSAASILMAMGVHGKVVQELLGHSKISTTMDIYTHTDPAMQRQAMDNLHKKFEDMSDGENGINFEQK